MKKYVITTLPITPESTEEKELCFISIEGEKLGQFLYGNEPILLAYALKSRTSHNSGTRKSKKNLPPSLKIPSQSWLEKFSQTLMEAGITYKDKPSFGIETKKTFSGFEFDTQKKIWQGHWQLKQSMEAFNSCYFDSWEIHLELNLSKLTGKYREIESIDRTD